MPAIRDIHKSIMHAEELIKNKKSEIILLKSKLADAEMEYTFFLQDRAVLMGILGGVNDEAS